MSKKQTEFFLPFTEFHVVETGRAEKIEGRNKKSAKPTISSEVKIIVSQATKMQIRR